MSVVNDFFAKSSFFDADCRCKILAARDKTAREAVDEAMELFEGDKIAHVIAPDGQAIIIDLLA